MEEKLEEIIELIYEAIHFYLVDKLGDDLDNDIIDINVNLDQNKELKVEIDLKTEVIPFSSHDIEKITKEAIEKGVLKADSLCESIIIDLKHKTKQES